MKTIFKALACAGAVVVSGLVALPAAAATLAHGETFCESANRFSFDRSLCDQGGRADLSNNSSRPNALTFQGSGTILGYVLDHSSTGTGKYPDFANITLEQDAEVTIELVDFDRGFDALFTWGDLAAPHIQQSLDATQTSYTFRVAAGTYLFGFDATRPTDSGTNLATSYALTIAAGPLPAASLMLLSALGGLAIYRRRRTA